MKDDGDYNFISITRCCRAEKRYEIIINTDSEEHYKATQDFARKLIDHAKPTTNADRIRAMTDEELAEFLWDFNLADVSTVKMGEFGPHMFRYRLKEWLQQPAEEDDHVV